MALEVLLEDVTSELRLEARVGVVQAKRQLKQKLGDQRPGGSMRARAIWGAVVAESG